MPVKIQVWKVNVPKNKENNKEFSSLYPSPGTPSMSNTSTPEVKKLEPKKVWGNKRVLYYTQ